MMQAGFLALGLVVLFGLITAWRHLHVLSNLWSTSYGIALIVKLIFAGSVFALGAWNWRRQRPTLGSEEAASSIRHSAIAELSVATLVLVATAIVVSLPAPKGLIRSTIRVILRSGKRQRRSFAWLAMTCRAPPPIV